MQSTSNNSLSRVFEREIARFFEATSGTRQDLYRNRRHDQRQHRECPLLVARLDVSSATDIAGTLVDISESGVGFLCDAGFRTGTLLGIRLFWSDVCSPRIPAIVRHCDIHPEGFLIGAEFAVGDPRAAAAIEAISTTDWHG
ncbi:MAG: PilZ domain-containing protein [Phycisphaerales bacterium]|nr:PilZ domain-containing protein [Phycisphaerales bacterium]MCB9864424.1 PilZ domain-containing protein [Phycisphaerales bacterium]